MNYITVLQEKLQTEIEHSRFLEELLKTLYGKRWNKLTLVEANKWRKRHIQPVIEDGRANGCEILMCSDYFGGKCRLDGPCKYQPPAA